ncbi:peptidoglycan binding protein CsiV [Vibrio sp. TH_r3]|uniref:peptidoglycan binding protein CsiV n=1 Tax=Vibrio sp. TH_r3 TaxID=3082084 RepID=UPI002955A3C0|nr:peptidoglycan binding protein CsiV [Vibrio sp. TH_r3]MDV7103036.1 peptidoglycan binding protein CsiV [Vibrio sp. TH_r3]
MKKLVTILLLLISLPAAARQFDIELIIFKRLVDPEQQSESWPNHLPPIDFSNVGSFEDTAYKQSKGVSVRNSYQLSNQVTRLNKHAGYQVLMHKVWRQGDQGKAYAPKFHIRAGKDYSTSFNTDGSEKRNVSNSDLGEFNELTIDSPLYELDGELQVYVQHYLFLETTLDLKAPGTRDVVVESLEQDIVVSSPETDDTVQFGEMKQITPIVQQEKFLKSYRMKQKRRMRSSETHYLDHPLLGIIVQVRKVQ